MAKQFDIFGRTVDEYIEGRIQEAQYDAVPFGNIVSFGSSQYELEGKELELFVRKVISSLLESGACVVQQAAPTQKADWEMNPRYQGPDIHCLVEILIKDWKTIDDGYGFFAWFAFRHNKDGRLRF